MVSRKRARGPDFAVLGLSAPTRRTLGHRRIQEGRRGGGQKKERVFFFAVWRVEGETNKGNGVGTNGTKEKERSFDILRGNAGEGDRDQPQKVSESGVLLADGGGTVHGSFREHSEKDKKNEN